MKRRFAYSLGDNYKKIYINDEMFKGYVCNLKLNNIDKPLIVFDGKNNICIRDNGYEWIEVYPDKGNYAITIIFDQNKNIIEWYFDIAKKIGIENDIPYEDDLYLDLIITLIFPFAKDTGTHPYQGASFLDSDRVIVAHPHGYLLEIDIIFTERLFQFDK